MIYFLYWAILLKIYIEIDIENKRRCNNFAKSFYLFITIKNYIKEIMQTNNEITSIM